MLSSQSVSPVPADFSIRLFARAIDTVVLVGVDVALGWVMGFGFDWLFLGAAVVLAYFVVFDVLTGATPGKFALGLRVLAPLGGHPTFEQAVIRESFTVLGAIPFAGPFLALGAWIWIATTIRSSPLRQGKHDLLAGGTRVVRVS
ncbi:MAG: RDD family protein [Acidobacteria bacterium]|nr:RDD family protein [Acidobacteriota bacterium]